LSSVPAAAAAKPLVVMQSSDPTSLDPVMRRETVTYNVTMNIFDSLLLRKGDTKLSPALATSWTQLDPTTWEFKLRKGVRFQNGEPFDAAAVKFTLDRILDPDTKSARRTGYAWVKRVEVVDEYTVRVTTTVPYPLTLAAMAELQIVPPKYYQEVGAQGFLKAPVGTGPYKFVSWTKDSALELVANEDYWRGKPHVSAAVFKPVPDEMTRVAAVLAGDADLITGAAPSLVARLDKSPAADAKVVTGVRAIFIGLDTNQNTPLKDKRVRQALNYAVDVDAIIKTILNGLGTRTNTLLTKTDFGWANAPLYHRDVEKAKALLAQAGYPTGFEITMDTPNGRYVNDVEVAQAIAGQLAEVGIRVKLNVREFASYNKDIFAHKQAPMYLLGWGNAVFDADFILYSLVRTKELLSNFSNVQIDKYLDEAHSTLDVDKRKAAYKQAVKLINEEAPYLFLYKQNDAYGISKRTVWEPRADEAIWLFDVKVK
jgi:peptide/nickel transport system substrate-binding protein